MDAAEHLISLQDPTRLAGLQAVQHRAAWSIDARQPQDLNRETGVQPGLLTGVSPFTARLAWIGRVLFRHPLTPAVSVDPCGGEIADPDQWSFSKLGPEVGEHRVLALCGGGNGGEHVGDPIQIVRCRDLPCSTVKDEIGL